MDKLPNEILHKIFICIPFYERIECLSVCRYWYDALFYRSFFYEVTIYNQYTFKKFVDIIQRMPDCGDQVEILDLELQHSDHFNYQKLCSILPNLRKIRFTDSPWMVQEKIFWDEPSELQNINSKIEEIKDSAYCKLARQLIMSNSCTRLISLELDLNEIDSPREEIFVHLKNTPTLKNLRLEYCNIGTEDCEIIHKNVPALETFHVKHGSIKDGELPLDIIPATSVKTFSIHVTKVENLSNHPNWYKYLAEKYTNLMDFEYIDLFIRGVNQSRMIELYREGIIPLYKNAGKQYDIFNAINIPTEVDIFSKFGEYGVRFDGFHFIYNRDRPIFTQLAESNLSLYAKQIEIEYSAIHSPTLLQNFTALTTLLITKRNDEHYWPTMNLTDYLNAFPPTLKIFRVIFGELTMSELPTHSSNIEELNLVCNILYPKFTEALSNNYFPKLNWLVLEGRVTENLNIRLLSHHLNLLKITAGGLYGKPANGFSRTTSESARPEFFIGENKFNDFSYSGVVPATAEDLQDRFIIRITCEDVDDTMFYTTGSGIWR